MRRKLLTFSMFFASAIPVFAGFDSWTADAENDPFSGGQRVTVSLFNSMRSGVIIICDSAEKGVLVRAIPGFAFEDKLTGYTPEIEFAIDGQKLLGQKGVVGAVGDNLAAAETSLSIENAKRFVAEFAKAKKQIAIKDGISDRPHLLPARGTTKSGAALVECMSKQSP